jgi:hypothetical protein
MYGFKLVEILKLPLWLLLLQMHPLVSIQT